MTCTASARQDAKHGGSDMYDSTNIIPPASLSGLATPPVSSPPSPPPGPPPGSPPSSPPTSTPGSGVVLPDCNAGTSHSWTVQSSSGVPFVCSGTLSEDLHDSQVSVVVDSSQSAGAGNPWGSAKVLCTTSGLQTMNANCGGPGVATVLPGSCPSGVNVSWNSCSTATAGIGENGAIWVQVDDTGPNRGAITMQCNFGRWSYRDTGHPSSTGQICGQKLSVFTRD
jgi:hypothetical protein